MSIDKLGAQSAARTYVQNTEVARGAAAKGAHKAHGHGQAAQSADSVSLSADARSLASAREAVQASPDVREQKVADIKQRVDSGTYEVPARVLARNIVDATNGQ